MKYNFCNFSEKENTFITEIFETSFTLTSEGFESIFEAYRTFKNNFDSGLDPEKGFVTINRNDIIPKTYNQKLLELYKENKSSQVGIDLPILLSPKTPNGKTIMFVAEDPLRDGKYKCDDVILSTPFGVHISSLRKKSHKVYWEVFEKLLEKGYRIYITDIFKIWIKDITKKGRNAKEKINKIDDLHSNFLSGLKKEIDWINPIKIVSYGNSSFGGLLQLNTEQEIVQIIHPAARDNHWKQKLLELNEGDLIANHENKIKYILSKIEKLQNNETIL